MMVEFELVLPCYNESKNLRAIVERAITAAQLNGMSPETFRLVLVQNGSVDDSKAILEKLSREPQIGQWFRVVNLEVNQGYGYGLWEGLKTTTAKFVGWSHADQQTDPGDAFRALKILKNSSELNGHVLVKGVRKGRSLKERIVSRVFELFAWFYLGHFFYEINAQPKVFERSLLKVVSNPPRDFAFDLYFLYCAVKAGYEIKHIPVVFPPRLHGLSNWAYSLKSRFRTILGMIKYMKMLRQTEGRLG
ncbi:MAG: glycosyltransferase [Bdellovibrionaceae bacterium]|nr:glycosyltransferase [Pseudobdellovibrionaceae bacterium]